MKTVIVGAGLAGLSAGHRLAKDFMIVEKEDRPGGTCRTAVIQGFTFDFAGHLLHFRDKKIKKFITNHTPVRINCLSRRSFIYSHGGYTKYPYQANVHGLPAEVAQENLSGFRRAQSAKNQPKDNFKDWVLATFGPGIAGNFLIPYNEKMWKYPLEKMKSSWADRFIPIPEARDLSRGQGARGAARLGYNASLYYPERGGIESVSQGIYEALRHRTRLNTLVKKIDLKNKIVYLDNGEVRYKWLISTISLKDLLKSTGQTRLAAAAAGLKATTVYALNVGYKKRQEQNRNWVYVPERQYPFHRLGFPHTYSPFNAPRGYQSVCAEVSIKGQIPRNIDSAIIGSLLGLDIITCPEDIRLKHSMVLKDAYVIFDAYRDRVVPEIERDLEKMGVLLAGRWGRWEYSSMEDAIRQGFAAADKIND